MAIPPKTTATTNRAMMPPEHVEAARVPDNATPGPASDHMGLVRNVKFMLKGTKQKVR
jgi:hypothetical protein